MSAAPTAANCSARARFWLGDTEISGGAAFKDSTELVQQALKSAYEQAFIDLNRRYSIQVERFGYFVLPAYQSALRLSQFGLSSVGLIHELRWRRLASGWPKEVSSATPSSSALRLNLSSAHGLASGDWVESYNLTGLSEDANGSFPVVVVDSDSLDILGNLSTGTYTSGGRLAHSTENWSDPLFALSDISLLPRSPQSQPEAFFQFGDYIQLPSVPSQIELMVKFGLSSTIDPTASPSPSMGIPNSLHYFGLRIAHYCAEARPAASRTKHNELAKKADQAWGELVNLLTLQRQASSPILSPQPLIEPPSDIFD